MSHVKGNEGGERDKENKNGNPSCNEKFFCIFLLLKNLYKLKYPYNSCKGSHDQRNVVELDKNGEEQSNPHPSSIFSSPCIVDLPDHEERKEWDNVWVPRKSNCVNRQRRNGIESERNKCGPLPHHSFPKFVDQHKSRNSHKCYRKCWSRWIRVSDH